MDGPLRSGRTAGPLRSGRAGEPSRSGRTGGLCLAPGFSATGRPTGLMESLSLSVRRSSQELTVRCMIPLGWLGSAAGLRRLEFAGRSPSRGARFGSGWRGPPSACRSKSPGSRRSSPPRSPLRGARLGRGPRIPPSACRSKSPGSRRSSPSSAPPCGPNAWLLRSSGQPPFLRRLSCRGSLPGVMALLH
jgi:hypothetical protein